MKKTTVQELRIKNPCKWCEGKGYTWGIFAPEKCSHCDGTGDHGYRKNGNLVTYKWVTVGRIE